MKTADRARRPSRIPIALCTALLFCVLRASFVAAVQSEETEQPRKETKEPDSAAQKRGNVIVEVRVVDAAKDRTPRPGARVPVHLSGAFEARATDENGQRRFTGIPIGTVDLTVMVPETEKCQVPAIAVTEGGQLVVVLVN